MQEWELAIKVEVMRLAWDWLSGGMTFELTLTGGDTMIVTAENVVEAMAAAQGRTVLTCVDLDALAESLAKEQP